MVFKLFGKGYQDKNQQKITKSSQNKVCSTSYFSSLFQNAFVRQIVDVKVKIQLDESI